MKIEKYPIKKYYDSVDISYIVVHVDLGTEAGTKNHLKNVASASYHDYVPKREGVVIEFVPTKYGAWHAGKVHKPTGKGTTLSMFGNPNRNSYGICLEAAPVDKNGNKTYNWNIVRDGEMPSESQIQRAADRIKQHGFENLPVIAHVDITSYKPKVVRKIVKRIEELLKEKPQSECLANHTVKELVGMLRKKLKMI